MAPDSSVLYSWLRKPSRWPNTWDSAARVELLLCANQLQESSRSTILSAINSMAAATDAGRANRVYATVLLVMACPEYLVQR